MAQDITLEQMPSDLGALLADLDADQGIVAARALSASLSLHDRAVNGGSVVEEAERLRRIAECCDDLTSQLERDPQGI